MLSYQVPNIVESMNGGDEDYIVGHTWYNTNCYK
jgi:hypothetical protein